MKSTRVISPAVASLSMACALVAGCTSLHARDRFEVTRDATLFAAGIASTAWSDARLTISPDGRTALWFSRNRPGGPGGYDIWMSRQETDGWQAATPAPFNTSARDFDPAFSADGRFVYFSSDRAGGLGGDDVWRVRVHGTAFGEPEPLGTAVNSPKNEWAPMLSPDGKTLLFSSDGRAGAGRMDLFTSTLCNDTFSPAVPLPGGLNTAEDEFDATFLDDGRRIVFSRAPDIHKDDVQLFHSAPRRGLYGHGVLLPAAVNTPGSDTYAPMLDWAHPHTLTFTTRRPADSASAADLYVVKYRD